VKLLGLHEVALHRDVDYPRDDAGKLRYQLTELQLNLILSAYPN